MYWNFVDSLSLSLSDSAFTVIQSVTNTLLAWIHGQESLGAWLNVVNAAFGVGGVLAPSLVSLQGEPYS